VRLEWEFVIAIILVGEKDGLGARETDGCSFGQAEGR